VALCANILGMTAVAPEQTVVVAEPDEDGAEDLVLADLLVEEISIDGMCGVY
jgi:mycofactocin precursor